MPKEGDVGGPLMLEAGLGISFNPLSFQLRRELEARVLCPLSIL